MLSESVNSCLLRDARIQNAYFLMTLANTSASTISLEAAAKIKKGSADFHTNLGQMKFPNKNGCPKTKSISEPRFQNADCQVWERKLTVNIDKPLLIRISFNKLACHP